jgi:hypothetical protein
MGMKGIDRIERTARENGWDVQSWKGATEHVEYQFTKKPSLKACVLLVRGESRQIFAAWSQSSDINAPMLNDARVASIIAFLRGEHKSSDLPDSVHHGDAFARIESTQEQQ